MRGSKKYNNKRRVSKKNYNKKNKRNKKTRHTRKIKKMKGGN